MAVNALPEVEETGQIINPLVEFFLDIAPPVFD
jgi:hypothetical protein